MDDESLKKLKDGDKAIQEAKKLIYSYKSAANNTELDIPKLPTVDQLFS